MKTMEEYLDEIADMVIGLDSRLDLAADFGDDDASLTVFSGGVTIGTLRIIVQGDRPAFDMEHACLHAGYLVGLAQSRLGATETAQ